MNVASLLTPKSEVVWIPTSASLLEALRKMLDAGYSAVPLVDDRGRYAGTVTEGDVLRHVLRQCSHSGALTGPIANVQRRTDIVAVRIDAGLETLVGRAIEQNFVPVTDDRCVFIGIVPRRPIIEQCARLAGLKSRSPT
jgi:CBS domain containing-hemolysin-like protein